MTTARSFPTPRGARRGPPRLFLKGRISTKLNGTVAWDEWKKNFGGGWREWWKWVTTRQTRESREKIWDGAFHYDMSERKMCHRHDGVDYHYCAPEDSCPEWSLQAQRGMLPAKAQVGWSTGLRAAKRGLYGTNNRS